jgi:DNA-binding NarL/FixJ family response regulator
MSEDDSNSNLDLHTNESKVNIVLVEDHIILREGLRSLLEMEDEFNVVGEAESCDEGFKLVKATSPHVVIVAIGLAGRSGLTLIPELKSFDAAIRALVLTARCSDEYVRAALESGADGYVLKDASPTELMTGIRILMEGQQYFSTPVASRIVSGFLNTPGPSDKQRSPRITPRESEVLTLIAAARSTKEIARNLGLSVKTVEKHRSNLMRKLALRSTAAVTLYAVRNNYLSVDGEILPKPNI